MKNNNDNPLVVEDSFVASKLGNLQELIEKMIRNPDGEAVYFGSTKGSTMKMDRKNGIRKYV